MTLNLTEAARAIGRNRTTVFRAIKTGKLSAIRDEATGEWLVEPAELFRVYAVAPGAMETADGEIARNGDSAGHGNGAILRNVDSEDRSDNATGELRARLEAAEIRLAEKDDTIADLRRRLDQEAEERRQAQTRLTALLTDQRARAAEPAAVLPDPLSPLPKLPEPEAAVSPPPRRRWWRW